MSVHWEPKHLHKIQGPCLPGAGAFLLCQCLQEEQQSSHGDGHPAEGATAGGCCLPSPDRVKRKDFCWLHKGPRTLDPSLTARLFFLCTVTALAGDRNAFCRFLLGKGSTAAVQGACILQQQMKMGHLRRMLPFLHDEDCRNSAISGMVASKVLFSQLVVSFVFLTFGGRRSGQGEIDKENAWVFLFQQHQGIRLNNI